MTHHLPPLKGPLSFEKTNFQLQDLGLSASLEFLHPRLHGKISQIAEGYSMKTANLLTFATYEASLMPGYNVLKPALWQSGTTVRALA
jgi:hypothetical protein